MNARARLPWIALLAAALAPGAGAVQTSDGYAALRAGEYDRAISLFRPEAEAGSFDALYGWTTALEEQGRAEEALARAAAAREVVPGALSLEGGLLLRAGRIGEARELLGEGERGSGEPSLLARLWLGVLEYEYGSRDAALSRLSSFIGVYNDALPGSLSARTLWCVGEALRRLSREESEYAHDALRALREARDAGALDHAPPISIGNLYLERYDARGAAESFQAVLDVHPGHPDALAGMAGARRLEGRPAQDLLEEALARNPGHPRALKLLARTQLLGGDGAAALQSISRALETNPTDLEALGALAAIHLAGGKPKDLEAFRAGRLRIDSLSKAPTAALAALSEISGEQRMYEDAVAFAREMVRADSSSWKGWGLLGLGELRLGRVDAARSNLERSFEGDGFNPWILNALKLLDGFKDYESVSTPRFELSLHHSEAKLLAAFMGPLAEEAYEEMSERYGARPKERIRIEVYPDHADFSVRTVGMVGIGALGVSFGPAIAMDSPSARERGAFNWASTLWHEIAHSFHLAASNWRVPRWFSEGLAVHEQRKRSPSWGPPVTVGFVRALASGSLRDVGDLDLGFSQPRRLGEVADSYLHASLVFEYLEERFGFGAILSMLRMYADGASNADAAGKALGMDLEALGRELDAWMMRKFDRAIASVGDEPPFDRPPERLPEARTLAEERPESFEAQLLLGRMLALAGMQDEALAPLERSIELFPQYGGADGAHYHLAKIKLERGRPEEATRHLERLLLLNESHYEARRLLAEIHREAGRLARAADLLSELPWIYPYEPRDHRELAELLAQTPDREGEIRARRALVALAPGDLAVARYELADALYRAGDAGGARSEVLRALEIAPSYDAALELLLLLRAGAPGS